MRDLGLAGPPPPPPPPPPPAHPSTGSVHTDDDVPPESPVSCEQ